ncbi:nuclear transcription factor Y subunit A-10-like [Bidens hawaiensis]|uniref:nuclear transcription factor Y subunit A-10-like n=1 Tax=Bidens hawaiensis TaxID=980011 RepID=UPI00404B148F
MNSVCHKEQDDDSGWNPMGSSAPGSGPWWSELVTRSTPEESIVVKSSMKEIDTFLGKVDEVDSDEYKNSSNKQKSPKIQVAVSMQSNQTYVDLGFGEPTMVCGRYPYEDQYYGVFSAYGPQIKGRIMLPLNLGSDDGPLFVNAKQYHGIIRRRRSRAKAEMGNKVSKSRKPYLHLSRHLHAMRRPRGNGGRFLNNKNIRNCKDENIDSKKDKNPPESPKFTILLSGHNMNSPRQSNNGGSRIPQSEVTSMFSIGDLKHFPVGNLSMVSLSNMMSGNTIGHGFGMHSKWVGAASTGGGGSCFNFAV